MFGNLVDDIKEKLDEQKEKLAQEVTKKAEERLVAKTMVSPAEPAPVQTLETAVMPTPTPDMAVPGAGKGDPAAMPVAARPKEFIPGVSNKVLLIGGGILAALLITR
ncbi:MAG: hypothetical protein F6K48_03155 [Okeania sp. SIO3H1]|nr:hypothetical protein [Okeania sp. SIO3H1]